MTVTAPAVGQSEAKRELARRELARRRLLAFGEYLLPWYETAKVHKLIAGELEQVEKYIRTFGKQGLGRLIIELQPRIGKTELVSKLFPAWLLGRMPNKRVMEASYAANLAHANSRIVREYVDSVRFQSIFGTRSLNDAPVALSWDSRSAQAWNLATPHLGGVIANGVGGGFTGFGGHLLVLDDPFKNREEAESQNQRGAGWDWWNSSFYTRREPGAAIVIVMTRWHPDDIVGRLLKRMATNSQADQYKVVSVPALAFEEGQYAKDEAGQQEAMLEGRYLNLADPIGRESGEAAWPERFGREELLKTQQNMSAHEWTALYQQQPVALTGNFFGPKWDIAEKAPEGLRWVRYWDLAVSEKKTADYTASAAVAYDAEGTLYIRDMLRGRWEWPKTQGVMAEWSGREDYGTVWGIENVAFQLAAFQDLKRDKRLTGRPIKPVTPEKDKFGRAIPLQVLQETGRVKLVRGPWIGEFIAEALAFKPDGTSLHDDQIDTVTGGMQMLRKNSKGIY